MSAAIPLSPVDSVFTGTGSYPLEFAFAYDGTIDAARLEQSLRRTLAGFPAVASRLGLHDGRFVLEPVAEGCPFEVRDSPLVLGEEGTDPRAFVAPVSTREGELVARVRLTQTPRGSVLGVAMSHAVADGFSYFHFLSSWSRAFRGEPFAPPSDERQRLAPESLCGADTDPAEAVREASGLFLDSPRRPCDRERLAWSRHLFGETELRRLMGEAQPGCPVRLSHNDVVAAWLWRRHVPQWTPATEPSSWLSCPVDVRRLVPDLPPTYFGCAVSLAACSIEREELLTAPLAALAQRVRAAVARVDGPSVARSLAAIETLRLRLGAGVFERLHVVHPRAGLLVTNLSRLPVREVAFDAGPPCAYDILVPAERCAVVLPAAEGLDVRVCLPGPAAA